MFHRTVQKTREQLSAFANIVANLNPSTLTDTLLGSGARSTQEPIDKQDASGLHAMANPNNKRISARLGPTDFDAPLSKTSDVGIAATIAAGGPKRRGKRSISFNGIGSQESYVHRAATHSSSSKSSCTRRCCRLTIEAPPVQANVGTNTHTTATAFVATGSDTTIAKDRHFQYPTSIDRNNDCIAAKHCRRRGQATAKQIAIRASVGARYHQIASALFRC
jgi:hypothetical protein